jgi:very-short-patch-repair endonuclease
MSIDAAVYAVHRLGGVARTRELRRAGIGKRTLTDAVILGRLLRPRRGIYVPPDTDPAIIEALSHDGLLACLTAARDHGLWTLDAGIEEQPHTWVSPTLRPNRVALDPDTGRAGCCVMHRDVAVEAPDRRRVGILQCLVQMLRCRGPEAFFVALESALHQRLLGAAGRARLRGLIPQGDRWLVDFARADAESGLESLLRLRLHAHGITLVSQVSLPGIGRVDFVIGDCLILEADGTTHGGDNRHRDLVRDALAARLGFVTLRFDYAMIVHEWSVVEDAILAVIARNLHRSALGLRVEGAASVR